MAATIKKLSAFSAKEQTAFLRRIAKQLRTVNVQQAIVITLRRDDGAIASAFLNPRGTMNEVIMMLERAKLEEYNDLIEKRRERGDG